MSQNEQAQQDQSTKDWLTSKEGRPVLIGATLVIVIFSVLVFWIFGKVFGSNEVERIQAEDLAAEGGGRARAETGGLQGNPRSQNLTEEAKGAVLQYNNEAAADDNLHPIPTFADVEEIPVLPVNGEGNVAIDEPSTDLNEPLAFEYQAPALPSNSRQGHVSSSTPAIGLTKDQVERIQEYDRLKTEAARALVQLYQPPPTVGSLSFSNERQERSDSAGQRAEMTEPALAAQTNRAHPQSADISDEGVCAFPLVRAGEIYYANNDIALNTDFQGPLRMTFLEGEIQGWRGMGSFELNEFGARMKGRITRLIAPNGESLSASGYVLDEETTLWAVASDVDRHIIYRYGGFGLGTILSAFSEIADAREKRSEVIRGDGTSSTQYREPDGRQVTYRVLGEFSRLWEEAFRDNMNRPITVTLDPNEQVGILFEDTVCPPESTVQQRKRESMRAGGRSDPVIY